MQITELLKRIHEGDPQALRAVIPLVYNELKKLAAGHLRREGRAQPIQITALVHEAFLRLAEDHPPFYENRSHFFGIASRLMRHIQPDESLPAIDDALEMRYFGGTTAEESAAVLPLSVHSVRRHMRLAQAWLHKEMSR